MNARVEAGKNIKSVVLERKNPHLLCFISGLLLTFSFPGLRWGFLAWFALVPFFFALNQAKTRRQAMGLALTMGMTFFLCSLHWLTFVTAGGWIALAFLETSFLVLFSLAFLKFRNFSNSFVRIFAIAAGWLAFEFMRGQVPVFSFGWNLLAYSQSDYSWVRLAANTAGAYGLGFVIAFVNACIFETIKERSFKPIFFGCAAFAFVLGHGIYHAKPSGENPRLVKIAVTQGNIPQSVKWEAMAREKIIDIYTKLTELSSYDQPDLIIWPEAAYPGYFNRDYDHVLILELIKKIGIPVLVGSPHWEGDNVAFNSAYLVGADGDVKQRYDKHRLVPFGEYVPGGVLTDWLKPVAYTMGVSDFSAGKDFTVFKTMNGEVSFSTLICFEDIFPEMARKFTAQGADFLAVITNDAWFGPTSAGYQHEQASIFRAIENGVPVVRSANTGVSSYISARGEVLKRLKGKDGKEIFVTGRETYDLPLEKIPTLFSKGGWIFPYAVFTLFCIMLAMPVKPAALLLLVVLFPGCIRLTGTAGYWKKSANEEAPTGKSVTLDSDDLVYPNRTKGNITT